MGEKFHDLELGKDFLGEKLKALTIKEKRINITKIKNKCLWFLVWCLLHLAVATLS